MSFCTDGFVVHYCLFYFIITQAKLKLCRWGFDLLSVYSTVVPRPTFLLSCIRWASDLAKFYHDWGPDLCESRWRAHSLIGVSFHINILRGLPCRLESLRLKFTNEPSIFCRRGFGWVDKAQCFRSARRFGATGSSPDFSRGFSRHGAPRPLSWTFFQCTLLSYPGQPSYSKTECTPATISYFFLHLVSLFRSHWC